MELERRLRKVAIYHVALFILPLLSLLYYGWWDAEALDQRPDNPLQLSPMALRGDIQDRRGRALAHSQDRTRVYPYKAATGPLVGYHLRGRNQSGLEALLQGSLSPPAPPKSLWGALSMDRQRQSGQPLLKGPKIGLTIDASLQRALYDTFQPRAGAVVVLDQSSGEILAAVSGPSFDPGEIARDWQVLRSDPRSPLIERVGSGLYPVRGNSGEPLLTAEQTRGHVWFSDNPFPAYPGASAAVDIDGDLLFSPLMLVQMVARQPLKASSGPRLIPETLGEPANRSGPMPVLGPAVDSVAGWQLFALQGPKFGDSPPFQVLLGRSQEGRSPSLAFAIVVEGGTGPEMEALRRVLLPILESYQSGDEVS